jgi:bacterioferritin-associated ferredoxin
MSNAKASYLNITGEDLHLTFDIDLSSEKIIEISYKGSLVHRYLAELEELKTHILNQKYSFALSFKAKLLTQQLKNSLVPLSLWLTHKAIEDYLGTTAKLVQQKDMLCLCFGISHSDLKKQVLSRDTYGLSEVVSDTLASSACGSCKDLIIQSLNDIRNQHGLVMGFGATPTRFDKSGHWLKIQNQYPSELIIRIEEYKKIWMIREGIVDQIQIEIVDIEGHHLSFSIEPVADRVRNEKILAAFGEYLSSVMGARFYLQLE